jgi:hypothetical protein
MFLISPISFIRDSQLDLQYIKKSYPVLDKIFSKKVNKVS